MNITSKEVAKSLYEWVFKDIGISWKIISNYGLQFVLNFMKELYN